MAGLLGPIQIRRRPTVDESDPLAGLHLDEGLLSAGTQAGALSLGQPIALSAFGIGLPADPQQPAEPASPTTQQPQKTSESATTRSAPQQTSKVGDILDSLTGGHFAARRERNAAAERQFLQQQREDLAFQQQQARQAEIERLAADLTGPERQLYLQDPEAYADVLKSRFEAVNMGGGDVRSYGQGHGVYQAPKFVEDEGVYGVQTVDGYQETGRRAPTEAELSEMAKREADIKAELERIAVARGQLGVAQGNLGVRRQEFEERKRQGGFGTPGVAGRVIGTELDPEDGW